MLILSLVLFFGQDAAGRRRYTSHWSPMGYLGAFITGIFFVSTFTVVPASVVLFRLAESLHPIEVALLAGLGHAGRLHYLQIYERLKVLKN